MAVTKFPGGARVLPVTSSVTTKHPSFLDAEPKWRRIADVLGGTDSIRANASDYIPMTRGHREYPETYSNMVARTSFTNYTGRALDGLEGLIFRKDPNVEVPYQYRERLQNINAVGDSINTFAKKVVRQALSYGRVGLLVDCLREDQQTDAQPVTRLPYLSMYTAENIVNWRPRLVDGQQQPDQIVLRESVPEAVDFGSIDRIRYRVLELDPEGRYKVRIFDQGIDGGEFTQTDEYHPSIPRSSGSSYLNKIPFVFINPTDLGMDIQRPPLLDLADANLAHYLLESEYSMALFYSAQPTPVISGWREDLPGDFQIGDGKVILLPEGATASMLEFRGHGLQPLQQALADKVAQIGELGAQLVQNASTGPETAEAARIRQYSKTSIISSIARTASDGFEAALDIALYWAMIKSKVSFELNQDFVDAMMAPQMMAELRNAKVAGLIRTRDWVHNLVQSELTEPGATVDQIMDDLETETPLMAGSPDPLTLMARPRFAAPVVDPDDEEE